MAEPRDPKPVPVWPGAFEAGLVPQVNPHVADLRGPREQCWMNIDAAEREKGAKLTPLEEQRIFRGKPWRSRKGREALAKARGTKPPFDPDE